MSKPTTPTTPTTPNKPRLLPRPSLTPSNMSTPLMTTPNVTTPNVAITTVNTPTMTPQTDKPRGGPEMGQKWVDLNHGAIENAKSVNGGIVPASIALYTSNYPYKNIWSTDNLPEELFYLQSAKNPLRDIKPGKFTRADGVELRKFDILPDYISVNVEGWLVQAWRTVDDRIQLQDVLDRMVEDPNYYGYKLKKPPKNGLSNDCYRGCRKILGSYNDYVRRDQPHRTTVESVEKMSFEKIWMNTVLDRSVEYPDRLVRVKFVRGGDDETGQYKAVPFDVTPENYHDTTFPIDYFCLQEFDPCVVSELEKDLEPAMSTLWDLQKKAESHRLEDWKKLDKECLPASWYDRTKGGAPKKSTFDGGCEICTWTPGHDAQPPKPQPFDFTYLRQRSASKKSQIDFSKAFGDGNVKYVTAVPKRDGLLNRRRESDPEKGNSTPTGPDTTVTRSSACAEAVRASKRVKCDMMGTSAFSESATAANFLSSIAQRNGGRYNMNSLGRDCSPRGFWDADTEVDHDSDSGTLTYASETPSESIKRTESFVVGTPPSFPGSPFNPAIQGQNGPSQSSIQAPKISTVSAVEYGADQQATAHMPYEFISNKHVKQDLPGRDYCSKAYMPNIMLEDPFSLYDNRSSFAKLGDWTPGIRPDFSIEKNAEGWNNIDEQVMHSLQNHTATLHGIMGFDPLPQNAMRSDRTSFNDSIALAGAESFYDFDAPAMSHLRGSTSYTTQAPMTPTANNAPGPLANLMWSDEFNRFEDFDSLVETEAMYESPLKKFNPGGRSTPAIMAPGTSGSAEMTPLSPSTASAVKANHPLYGRKHV